MNLIQLHHRNFGRSIAVVREPHLALLSSPASIYELARRAIDHSRSLSELVEENQSGELLPYDDIYAGASDWQILPAFDHPDDPSHCVVSGTGLTHKASAANRDKMHDAKASGTLTDSMQMYLWGMEGGRPARGTIGAQPEWFYKGSSTVLRAHRQPLEQPPFADDAGEEPEVAAVYLVDGGGMPWRIGFATANEFSDHVMEKKNYLYLAHSKLRQCAIGPELAIGGPFQSLRGAVTITRAGQVVWSQEIETGEEQMAHSLANLEYHHFKYPQHRVPWQAHVHFLGAAAFSFGAQVKLEDGDVMEIAWRDLGRPLRNVLKIDPSPATLSPISVLAD
jgi:hypothetical protein